MKDEKVQGMEVNAESGEIIIRNSHGDYAIVPRKDRKKIQDLMDEGCDSCIDNYVMTLPTHKDYAEEGTLIPEGEPVKGESFTPEGTELKAIVIDNKVYIDDGQGGKVQLGGSQGDKILAEYQVSKNKQQEVLEEVTQDVIDKKVGKQETQGSIAMSDEEVEGSQEDLSATIQTQTANASNNEEPIRGFLRDVLDRKQLKDYDKSVKAGLDPYQTLYEMGIDFTVGGKSYGKTETTATQEEVTTTDVTKQTVEANKQEEVLESVTQDVIESKVGKEQEVVEEPAVLSGAKGEDLSSLSFDDAFRLARKTQNAGGTFVYNGKTIGTNYATEAEPKEDKKTTQEKESVTTKTQTPEEIMNERFGELPEKGEKERYLRWYDNKFNLSKEEINKIRKSDSPESLAKLKDITEEEAKIEYDKINQDIELAVLKVKKEVKGITESGEELVREYMRLNPGQLDFNATALFDNLDNEDLQQQIDKYNRITNELKKEIEQARLWKVNYNSEHLNKGESPKEFIKRIEGLLPGRQKESERVTKIMKERASKKPKYKTVNETIEETK